MNILYIGPFQKNNSLGYVSSIILEKLCHLSGHKIYAHPIYSGYDNRKLSSLPYLRFADLIEYPDINIQHSTINSLYIDQKSKNYFIPIHPMNLNIPKQYYEKLKCVDKILVHSDFELDKFLNIGIKSENLVKLELPKIESNPTKLSLGIYDSYKKYYFIGDYSNNKNIIEKLIKNFLVVSKHQTDTCLVVASECNSQQKQELIKFYEKQKENIMVNNYEDRVLLLVDDVGCDRIQGLHNCADVYLCINDGHYPLTDASMANLSDSITINYPTEGLDSEHMHNSVISSISNNKIIDILKNIENNNISQKYKTTKLQEVLC